MRRFKRLAARERLQKASLHDLRHLQGTILLQQEGKPSGSEQAARPANVATTLQLYGHVLPRWGKQAAAAFAKAMDEG